jgi:hypothetical protein
MQHYAVCCSWDSTVEYTFYTAMAAYCLVNSVNTYSHCLNPVRVISLYSPLRHGHQLTSRLNPKCVLLCLKYLLSLRHTR